MFKHLSCYLGTEFEKYQCQQTYVRHLHKTGSLLSAEAKEETPGEEAEEEYHNIIKDTEKTKGKR